MSDAEWIYDLVAHGLVRPSFVPPPPIRHLPDLTRRRSILLADRTPREAADGGAARRRSCQGVRGRDRHLRYVPRSHPGRVDHRRMGRAAPSRVGTRPNARQDPRLAEAPVGRFKDHHAFLANMICQHVETINAMIADLDERLRPTEASSTQSSSDRWARGERVNREFRPWMRIMGYTKALIGSPPGTSSTQDPHAGTAGSCRYGQSCWYAGPGGTYSRHSAVVKDRAVDPHRCRTTSAK